MSTTVDHALYLRRAIELATENVRAGRGGPFAAVVVKDGVIVGEAANSVTTTNDPTAHGEVNAIRAACRQLNTFSLAGCTLYTSCYPCPMCMAASMWARLDAVYYGATMSDAARAGFDDAKFYDELAAPNDRRSMPLHPLLGDEAWQSFDAWLNLPSRVDY